MLLWFVCAACHSKLCSLKEFLERNVCDVKFQRTLTSTQVVIYDNAPLNTKKNSIFNQRGISCVCVCVRACVSAVGERGCGGEMSSTAHNLSKLTL
jgi:hypothetical protein